MSVSGIGGAAAHQVYSRPSAARPPKGANGPEKSAAFLASVVSAQAGAGQAGAGQAGAGQAASAQAGVGAAAGPAAAGAPQTAAVARGGVAAATAGDAPRSTASLTNTPTQQPEQAPPERREPQHEGDAVPSTGHRLASDGAAQDAQGNGRQQGINHHAFRAYTPAPQARSTASVLA